jgi:chromosome segregation ATPase
MTESVLEAIGLVSSADLYKERLLELDRKTREAKAAVEAADKAKEEARNFTDMAEAMKQQHESRLNAKQKEHDDAASEAAARIRVGHEQAAELMRVKEELDAREAKLDEREYELDQRTTEVLETAAAVSARKQKVEAAERQLEEKREKARAFLDA